MNVLLIMIAAVCVGFWAYVRGRVSIKAFILKLKFEVEKKTCKSPVFDMICEVKFLNIYFTKSGSLGK